MNPYYNPDDSYTWHPDPSEMPDLRGPTCPDCGGPMIQTPRVDACARDCGWEGDYYPDASIPER